MKVLSVIVLLSLCLTGCPGVFGDSNNTAAPSTAGAGGAGGSGGAGGAGGAGGTGGAG